METGDKIKVIKDNHSTGGMYIGLIGTVSIVDETYGNRFKYGISFNPEENEKCPFRDLLINRILYFDDDEINKN